MKIRLCMACFVFLSLSVAVQNGRAEDLAKKFLGTWKSVKLEGENIGGIKSLTLEFKKDGACQVSVVADGEKQTRPAKYKVDKEHIVLTVDEGKDEKLKYKFEGEELLLEDVDEDARGRFKRVEEKEDKENGAKRG